MLLLFAPSSLPPRDHHILLGSYHLVHCTAAHSCHDRLRQLDRAMETFAARIRRRRMRMRQIFEKVTLHPPSYRLW